MNRVLLIDDHTSFREALTFMFEREPGFEVTAQAGSLAEAREALSGGVDLAVLQIKKNNNDGAEIVGEMRWRSPRTVALVLTASSDREKHARAVEAGAAGVLHKSAHLREVIEAARKLVEGESLLSQNETIELLRLASRQRQLNGETQAAIARLTPREREVLQALAEGLSDKEIAANLYVSPGTVRNHIVKILSKLGVHSRLQALVFAVRHGLVQVD